MKIAEPAESTPSRPYWEATREARLVLPWCASCEAFFWYPRVVCPTCLADTVEWRDAAGTGEVYAVSVMHKTGMGRDPADGPYAVAIIELDEGVRMLSNVIGVDPDEVTVGSPVRVVWHDLSDGRKLPMFEPDA